MFLSPPFYQWKNRGSKPRTEKDIRTVDYWMLQILELFASKTYSSNSSLTSKFHTNLFSFRLNPNPSFGLVGDLVHPFVL